MEQLKVKSSTGEVHAVWKYILTTEEEEHIWCNTWYGHHRIGVDCEWYEEPVSAPSVPDSYHGCTLTDQELIVVCEEWIQKLIDSGGKEWCMFVPARPNKDPDLLFSELVERFKVIEKLRKENYELGTENALLRLQPQSEGVLQWVKAADELPEKSSPPMLYIIKWYSIGRQLKSYLMTRNQLADLVKANIDVEYFWLRESSSLSTPQEEGAGKISEAQFMAKLDHIGRIYEATKGGVYTSDQKTALDGLQELRNICCEYLQALRIIPH